MVIEFTCSGCQASLIVHDEQAGKIHECSQCGYTMTVPSAIIPPTIEPPPSDSHKESNTLGSSENVLDEREKRIYKAIGIRDAGE